MATFKLSEKQWQKFKTFEKEQDQKVAKLRRVSGAANYGAIGGGYKFVFTPTNMGTVAGVINQVTKDELNLTDYNEW